MMEEHKTTSGSQGRKLYKSSTDRIIDGVCGGIAEYFGVDASVVRLIVIALSIFSIGAGILFYIIAMLVIPMEPIHLGDEVLPAGQRRVSGGGGTLALVSGIIIVIIGLTLLFDYYSVFSVTTMWHYFGRLALPVVFILIGGALLLGRESKKTEPISQPEANPEPGTFGEIHNEGTYAGVEKKRLTRSGKDKKIAGVCGGLADYMDVDPTIVRLVFVLLAFASFGLAVILYVVSAFVIPKEVAR